jgi:hypothetical protein
MTSCQQRKLFADVRIRRHDRSSILIMLAKMRITDIMNTVE